MCLVINKKFKSETDAVAFVKKPKIAKSDIIVYKMLEIIKDKLNYTIFSPYKYMRYVAGETKTCWQFGYRIQDYLHNGSYVNRITIDDGIHAFTTRKQVNETIKFLLPCKCFAVKCIIPKGTPYFRGDDNDIVSLALQMPEKIRIPAKYK